MKGGIIDAAFAQQGWTVRAEGQDGYLCQCHPGLLQQGFLLNCAAVMTFTNYECVNPIGNGIKRPFVECMTTYTNRESDGATVGLHASGFAATN